MTEFCFAGCGAILPICGEFRHKGHVLSRYDGGTMEDDNIRIICQTCNLQMRTEHMFSWMKRNGRKPPTQDEAFEAYECGDIVDFIDFQPRDLRHKVVNGVLKTLPVCGVISACTGSGKTAMCVEGIGAHLRGKILLWITEFDRILDSQFTPYNIASWKRAGFVPESTAFLGKMALNHCDEFPDTCIIYSTIDTARQYYTKICYDDRFLGFVIDESHHSDGHRTFDMLYKMKSTGCPVVLGLSATHTDSSRTRDLFGDNPYLNDYTLLEGWRDGIIREVQLLCCMIKKKLGGGSQSGNVPLFDRVQNPDVFIKNLKDVLHRTQTRKGIIWCERTDEADRWYEFIKREFANDLTKMRIYVDHTGVSNVIVSANQMEFNNCKKNAIMITAQKYGEGVDIKHLDFAGVISENTNAAERVYLQRVGRLLRNEGRSGPALFCNFSVVTDLETYTDQMKNVFIDYYNGVKRLRVPPSYSGGTGDVRESVEFDTENNRIICTNGITFEFLDDIRVAEIFEKRDAEFAADMIYNTGRGLSFSDIKKVLKDHQIDDPADAQIFFGSCCEDFYPAIARWWNIAKYLPMDYTRLLDLDNSQCYQTLQEARLALREVENAMSIDQLKLIQWNDRYKEARRMDPRLPKDWRGMYNLIDPKQYWNPKKKR